MTHHHLGLELRQLVLRDRLEGRGLDPRRLQAAIGDLCGAEHRDLVGPLRYLVLSAAFASAAGQDPPLADPRLLGRLQQELAQMYAERLCQRLQPVLEGLLGMAAAAPDAPLWPSVPVSSPAAVPVPVPPAPLMASPAAAALAPQAVAPQVSSAAPPRPSGVSPLTVVLAFVSGMLLMALAGIGLYLQQRPPSAVGSRPLPQAGASGGPADQPAPAVPAASEARPQPEADAALSGPGSPAAETEASPASGSPEALDRSLGSVRALYEALSAKDYARARSLFGGGAADQFDPAFFDQFTRVTVQDLRPISQSGSSVNLEGVVSFVYPDGSLQTETRTFTLDSSSDPPLITASAFGRVIKPR